MEISRRVQECIDGLAILHRIGLILTDVRDFGEKWEPREMGWFKLNVDGMCCEGGDKTVCGDVIRDHEGCWIRGFRSGEYYICKILWCIYVLKLAPGKKALRRSGWRVTTVGPRMWLIGDI